MPKVSDPGKGQEEPPCGIALESPKAPLQLSRGDTSWAQPKQQMLKDVMNKGSKGERFGFLFFPLPALPVNPPTAMAHFAPPLAFLMAATAQLLNRVRVLGLAMHLSKHLKEEEKVLSHAAPAPRLSLLPRPGCSQRPNDPSSGSGWHTSPQGCSVPSSVPISPAKSIPLHRPRCPQVAPAVCSATADHDPHLTHSTAPLGLYSPL